MAPRGTKRASSTSASQPPAKKPTPAQSSSPKALPSRRHGASIRDSFEEEIDSRHDKNNNDDEAADDDSSLERLSDDDDVVFRTPTRQKRQMPAQPPPVIIKSTSVSQNSPGDNDATTMPTNEKKSRKAKIPGTPSTKEAIAEAKRPNINDLVDDLADVVGSTFLQGARNQADYEDRALAYHYRLSLILRGFNQAELDVLFSTSLPSFYGRCDKDSKKALRDAFESAYHQVERELIANITAEANLWLQTPAGNNYHDRYHLARSKRSTKVKLPPVPGLPSDLELFLDHKGYHLDDVIYMRIMVGALAVCETTDIPVVKYRAENPENNIDFSIWFSSDDVDGLLYLAMMNVYPALIVGFASRLTTVPNRKLHTAAFRELLRLVPTFSLPPSREFQLSLPSFRDPLPNPRKAVAALQLVLKSPLTPCGLDPSYYTPAETAATDEAIAAAMPAFVAKATDIENEHLRRHAVNLMDDLEPLQSTYLREHNLTSIAPIVRSSEQARAMGEQFNNLPLAGQVQMMHAILDEEETRLHAMIRATLERIDSISQERKSLQAREEKLGRVLQMITKVSKDLETEGNTVEQSKSSIENLDRKITEAQNPSSRLPDVSHTISAAAVRSAAAVVQAQRLRASAAQAVNQATTKAQAAAKVQTAIPTQPAAETPVLVGGHTDQEESPLSINPFSPVTSSGLVRSNSAPATTAFNSSQPTVQPADGAHGTDDQLEDVYSVFLRTI